MTVARTRGSRHRLARADRRSTAGGRGGGGAWGAPNVNFQIIEAGQEKAQVQSADRQPNGDVLVKMIIGEVKRDYGRGGFDKLNAGRFGLKPTVRAKG